MTSIHYSYYSYNYYNYHSYIPEKGQGTGLGPKDLGPDTAMHADEIQMLPTHRVKPSRTDEFLTQVLFKASPP